MSPSRAPLATIDIGTNSVLLQIARAGAATRAGEVEVLDDRATITRLGRGVDRTRRLDDAAVERTLSVLAEYAKAARAVGARIAAVGTSALRDGDNAASFLERARAILGVSVEVIRGEREAELTFLGATQGLGLGDAPLCVVDVGGGSTEIVLGRAQRVLEAISLDVGAVRMHERHALSAPTTSEQLARVDADVTRALATSPVAPCAPLVAIAGTATTLAAIAGAVVPYDAAKIHGTRLPTVELIAMRDRLAAMSLAERQAVPGLDPGRADVIVAGASVLLAVVRAAQADEIIVSNGGVRMGLAVAELMSNTVDSRRSSE